MTVQPPANLFSVYNVISKQRLWGPDSWYSCKVSQKLFDCVYGVFCDWITNAKKVALGFIKIVAYVHISTELWAVNCSYTIKYANFLAYRVHTMVNLYQTCMFMFFVALFHVIPELNWNNVSQHVFAFCIVIETSNQNRFTKCLTLW